MRGLQYHESQNRHRKKHFLFDKSCVGRARLRKTWMANSHSLLGLSVYCFFFFFAVTSSAMSRPFKCNYSQLDSAKNYSTKNLLVLGGVLKRVELHCRYMLLYKFITSESCCKMYALFLLNKEKAFLSLTLVNLAQKNCADKKWISNFTRVSASGWSWMVISVDFRKDANLFGHLCDILKAIWELHFLVFLI